MWLCVSVPPPEHGLPKALSPPSAKVEENRFSSSVKMSFLPREIPSIHLSLVIMNKKHNLLNACEAVN